jgi:hypothetical protein
VVIVAMNRSNDTDIVKEPFCWLSLEVESLAGVRNVSCSPNVPRTCTTNCANLIESSPFPRLFSRLERQTIPSYTV